MKVKVKLLSRVPLFANPWTVAYQASPSMGFSRQEYQSGLPFPSPGDLPDPGIIPGSPALQADALPSDPPGKPWKTIWRFLKKLKMELPYDPTIPLLGIHLEKNMIWKDTCTPMFTAALLTIAKTWKQSKCPLTKEWIKKKRCGTYIQWNINHPLKRKNSCHL